MLVSAGLAQGWRPGEMQVLVGIQSPEQAEMLAFMGVSFEWMGTETGQVRAYLVPDELERIRQSGMDYSVEVEDLNRHYENYWLSEDFYHSYQQIIDLADSLEQSFPSICKKHLFGQSVAGRQLAALKISDNVGTDEPEPEVMFDGGIHGDEIGCSENVIRFARDLCLDYGVDPTTTDLVNNREIWLYLMVNPDGRVNMSRYNNNGVDLNRDWCYMWDSWGGSPGACSQVESKALRDCMYGNQFVVHTTYHSGTEFISYPWSYRSNPTPDQAHIDQLAALYSSVSGYSNLPYGQGYSGMYAINGSTKDGNYGIMGSISWSLEISNSKQPPASQIMLYYNRNYPSMMTLIEYSGYGLQGLVTDAVSGQPVAASIFVSQGSTNYFPTYTDPEGGDYHKYVLPGTYSIRVVANGYVTQIMNSITVVAGNPTNTDFQLQPQEGQFVYRFTASQIPDNNSSDEGNTPAVIGPPDNINYSIGKNGWCILDMQIPIADGAGPDIRVHEGDSSPEGYTCYAGETIDGPWISMGTGTGTTEFDIAQAGLPDVQFIKIVDDGDGQANVADAGFDLDAIEALEPVSGIYLALFEYVIDDASGNNNGKIDPGETVDLIVTLRNNGDVTAENVTGTVSVSTSFITLNMATVSFGNIAPGGSASGTFTFTASPSTPAGYPFDMNLDVTSNGGTYNNSFVMSFVVGQIPVIIIDLDGNHNSAPAMEAAMQANGINPDVSSVFPADIGIYSSAFVCLGVYSDNHVLTSSEGQALAAFLNNGGRVYMEGGDTWYYDPATPVHSMFNINGVDDGDDDLGTINGQAGTFTEGMSFSYNGDNLWIDHIEPISPAYMILMNQSPSYGTGVAYDQGSYRTIGCSHEFGGLTDGATPSTKEELMHEYLAFFGVLPDYLMAAFTADQTEVCEGETVNFTDNSSGNVTSWSWEFPGGTPATSTQQDPSVVYNTAGTYDVTLTVSDGTNTHSLTKENYISVLTVPPAPGTPQGPEQVCVNLTPTTTYNTSGSAGAESYIWDIQPQDAGSISGTGTTGTVAWNLWEGTATISVKAVNDCGESAFSQGLEVWCVICTGAAEIEVGHEWLITPNPNDGRFIIQNAAHDLSGINLRVLRTDGKEIYSGSDLQTDSRGEIRMNIPEVPAGVYILAIRTGQLDIYKKIVIY
ncbi:MAG: PKD domain-containing protein [Bacteroidales bacterium]|nr:PKD domain-containing protein [Bacteroidales bacterium]